MHWAQINNLGEILSWGTACSEDSFNLIKENVEGIYVNRPENITGFSDYIYDFKNKKFILKEK